MGDAFLGFAILAVIVVIWNVLGRHAAGRAVQTLLTATVYALWLGIIPLTFYFVGQNINDALAENRYGTAVFVAVASLTLIPVLVLPLIAWNYFCRYVWRKVGLKLPQSGRLDGYREYYDWERQR